VIHSAPDLSPVPVRLAVPPLRPVDLPPVAPVVVSLAVPPLPGRPLAAPVPVSADAPPVTARQDATAMLERGARWVHERGPWGSLLLSLGLVLLFGWLVMGMRSDVPLWLASIGGMAWGWYWWRGRAAGARILALCGGLVLCRSVVLLFGFGSTQRGELASLLSLLLGLLYFLSWCVVLVLGAWRGSRALARGWAKPSGPVAAVPSGSAAAPSLMERMTSRPVQIEGSASGVVRIRDVSLAEKIKLIYWSLRLVSFVISVTVIAFYHDSIFHWIGEQLARNTGPMAEGYVSYQWGRFTRWASGQ
jgi:hypothetical protein